MFGLLEVFDYGQFWLLILYGKYMYIRIFVIAALMIQSARLGEIRRKETVKCSIKNRLKCKVKLKYQNLIPIC